MTKVILTANRSKRIEKGHPWVFRTEIEKIQGNFSPGDIVEVYDHRGKFLGKGYINPRSQITVRFLTRNKDEAIDRDFFKKRILDALSHREKLGFTGSFRLVYGEADLLPALIVDKFEDVFVIQTLALGMERFKGVIVDILKEIFEPRGIYERNDAPVRELEGLPQVKGCLYGEVPERIIIEENGLKLYVDVINGQKTGYFFDQKENRRAIEPLVKGAEVLECFCYTGSFALSAARYGAKKVLAFDSSRDAVELARENAVLNGLDDICEFQEGNAFDVLRQFYNNGKKFDVVILDPPAFAKNKQALESAIRGYKEINLRSLKLLKPGGFLITSSCSHHVDEALFWKIIESAAWDARVNLRIIESRTQAKDHPILAASEETRYLKFLMLQVM
ncbi:class I SAM-dependent rRNA methyltransferase [Thermosediminibacter litoriperuensis]|uniref:23S rRNA (Cytosine1962-C5)-methyltransferase n=1 Tax=Thermosediminibacter litoriperuensis TaxID=291989 RepID=A0A5S5AX93_9FIRM|nr:class I SAM-dependent rRNA methyltransferase [Thermosediminibacter litoriperuensis]TYP56702.1 23S rRNA (cytosine1962-C5)-methyltransferase [Thermosediminibacter litoriperuensis]